MRRNEAFHLCLRVCESSRFRVTSFLPLQTPFSHCCVYRVGTPASAQQQVDKLHTHRISKAHSSCRKTDSVFALIAVRWYCTSSRQNLRSRERWFRRSHSFARTTGGLGWPAPSGTTSKSLGHLPSSPSSDLQKGLRADGKIDAKP